ncbi:putative phosphatase homologous to the C-terminal domain of histone macroH2A1 [Geoglobus ahangari]|uniref:Putative phosphatase homologous to the C-terminal domain of histone macroH2A1 n=1 Tax=Geoglobus ahangari TaxID=113653 RepID=A0A0F7ICE9_9EURY|nr:[protein ADP-ribosylglutamate] hydrolase [Geoglobus ahangari]AKG90939.1 putative phosphatase homologous to the C-terminal domain of histone macroH2A1 [Geoglobus ahangari]
MKPEVVLRFSGVEVRLVQGDITKYPAEAIVNAANRHLEHGGGVAYAIARACAGNAAEYTRISKEAMREQVGRDYIEHGEVVVTPAMRLEENGIRYVIHTVGPICRGKWGESYEEKLRLAFLGPLKKAEELGLKSIAFPAVSAGIYGCPLEMVVETFLKVVEEFSEEARNLKVVALVIYDSESLQKAKSVFEKRL